MSLQLVAVDAALAAAQVAVRDAAQIAANFAAHHAPQAHSAVMFF